MAAAFAASDEVIVRSLKEIKALLTRRRRAPIRAIRRSFFGALRVTTALQKPTGSLCVLSDRDGVGRALAMALEQEASSCLQTDSKNPLPPSLSSRRRVAFFARRTRFRYTSSQPASSTAVSLVRLGYLATNANRLVATGLGAQDYDVPRNRERLERCRGRPGVTAFRSEFDSRNTWDVVPSLISPCARSTKADSVYSGRQNFRCEKSETSAALASPSWPQIVVCDRRRFASDLFGARRRPGSHQ